MGKHIGNANSFGFAHHFILPVLAIVAVGGIGVVTLRMSSAANTSYISAKNYYNTLDPALSDDMNNLSEVQSKWYANASYPSSLSNNRLGFYNPTGVKSYEVKNGALSLIARRHCVANASAAETQANASTAKCAKGKTTKYSAGRLESKQLISGTFLIDIRAKMPSTHAAGVRAALWMFNVPSDGSPTYCGATAPQTNLSEFDILEWYTDGTSHRGINKPTSNTHVLCNYNATTKAYSHHESFDYTSMSSSWYKKWHIFSLRFNGISAQYFIDGKLVNVVTNTDANTKKLRAGWNTAPTLQQWNQAMQGMSWRFILNQDVLTRAKNGSKFPTQTTLIDYVHVYKHAN